ncbi:transposase [Algoriphagus sp. AGSA1]|uniref:REP-associated tyrosine transposase n=1 Tax=Algoriphagus sp. AGSA1 TaxID=2907213 RepID=UPI001F1CAFBF|nr:transposase [Algoriphagus sp. AGSA1]MCE7055841.1 transposase [Algoriphagus sp. AGSA1]
MSRKYKIRDQERLYFVTFTIVEWIDLFTRKHYRDILIGSLKYCQNNKGLDLCAFCIMSSHIHLIIGRNSEPTIEAINRDFKKYTSIEILKPIQTSQDESRKEFLLDHFRKAGAKNPNNANFQLWQQHNHPIELNTSERISRCLNYIHQNPVVAGLVYSAEDYVYSSVSNYAGLPEKMIDVLLIE